jgi:predicted hydrocarbon binding protein
VHGFIFTEIKKYVGEKLGRAAWPELLQRAGLGRREFENFLSYPDEEAVALVGAAAATTGLPADAILEDFGAFLGEDLVEIYRPLIDPAWRTLEFLANVEETIHHVVRSRNRQAAPPNLVCRRSGPHEVVIVYRSQRRLCALARGIVRGVAQQYGEQVEVREETCMHRGAPSCEIHVERRGGGAQK